MKMVPTKYRMDWLRPRRYAGTTLNLINVLLWLEWINVKATDNKNGNFLIFGAFDCKALQSVFSENIAK